MNKPYRVLLYYQYATIENPEAFKDEHLKFCKELGVLGRILISQEGINGTLSGTKEQTDAYIAHMRKDDRFKDTVFKTDEEDEHAFDKIFVRVKKELVNLSLEDDINPLELTGKHLKPHEWYEAMKDPNTVILDARNDYEYDLGHFKGAVKPDIQSFRELPQWVRDNKESLEGKKILTYCTGGVRCEKFSGFLKAEGFEDVSQLDGGIVTYGKDAETQGQDWNGSLYVFDKRISVPVNKKNPIIVGKDYYTGEPTERYVNCGNPDCNKQLLLTEESENKYFRSCSKACMMHPRNRYVISHHISYETLMQTVNQIQQAQ